MALHLADESTGTGGTTPPLSLISQHMLETATYERSGANLVLVTEEGERLTVADYFANPTPPDLMASNGAFLSGNTVSLLAGRSPVHVAQAGTGDSGGALRIGLVETLAGTATAQRLDGSIVNLKTGDPVFQGDVVKVSADGKLGLSFLDKSVFSLSGGGTMTLNEMIYDPGSTTNKMVFGLVNGSLSFVTGAVAPSGGVTIETPVAVMAIRGTIPIALDVGGGKYLILSEEGRFEVIPKLPGSEVLTIDDSGKAIYFPFGLSGAPQVIDLAGSGLEDEVALLVRQLNEARQEFLQRRADATGSPNFAEYETFTWVEGEVILTKLATLLSPLLQATQIEQNGLPDDDVPPPPGTAEGTAASTPSVVTGTATAALTETNEAQSAGGRLIVTDDDPATAFIAQGNASGSNGYGSFSIDADGNWTYVMSSAQDGFIDGQTYTDSITVITTDGTTQIITVTITGTDDQAVITGTAAASLTETDAPHSANGKLTISDLDDPAASFVPQTDIAGSNGYGSFSIDADGNWTYTMFSASDAFVEGQQYTDTIIVTATDGTTQVITVTITGSDDQAVITGTATGDLTETDVPQSANGKLNVSDLDDPEASFVAQANVTGSNGYGSFTIDAEGNWTYLMSSAQDSFVAGQTYTDSITVATTDGTTQVITVTITGSNDGPVAISAANAVAEDAVISGTVSGTDADSGETASLTYAVVGAAPAGLMFNPDGSYSFDATGYDSLPQGEVLVLSIPYTVTDIHGATSEPANLVITITGTNDGAVIGGTTSGDVIEDPGLYESEYVQTASGSLTITDADEGEAAFVPQTDVEGDQGVFSLTAEGNWTYTPFNDQESIQQLGQGDTLTETFTAVSEDGTTQAITITITGTNDAAEIGGTLTGSVAEDGWVYETETTATGILTISDVDAGEASFVPQSDVETDYGTFSLTADGNWTYTANNDLDAIQELGQGDTLTDIITVSSLDGTTQAITITITGTNDAAVIAGAVTGNVTEDVNVSEGKLKTSGILNISDVDAGEATFVAQTNSEGLYGRFSLDANGSWTYEASNAAPAIQELGSGETLSDSFDVTSADGTVQQVTITITGTNDAATITGTATGSVQEDVNVQAGSLVTSGNLTVTDPDRQESTFVAQTGTVGSLGTFSITAAGAWTYSASNSQAALQSLGAGDTQTEFFTVQSVDGTTQQITITIHGTNDGAVIAGDTSGNVIEDMPFVESDLMAFGTLTINDADAGESSFIPQSGAEGTYGMFSLDAAGAWSYAAFDGQQAIQQLPAGAILYDIFTAVSVDGTEQVVTITITGTNDVAQISGISTGSVTEDGYFYETAVAVESESEPESGYETDLVATGYLTISDVDIGQAYFIAQSGTEGDYGTFTLDADGCWTYTACNGQQAIQQLGEGDTLTDTFTAVSADGTTQPITITITGTNDVAQICGVSTACVTEDTSLTASGTLTIYDVDAGEAEFRANTNAAGTYGTFTLDAAGNWTYNLTNTNPSVQALNDGDQLFDYFTAVSADGSACQTITVTIKGTTDGPVLPPPYTGSDDPNDYDDLGGYPAIYYPEVTYESGESGRETWNGTDEGDVIEAGEADDTVYGHGGNDVINGNGGNDTGNGGGNGNGLYGQFGNDTMSGGNGKDQIYGGSGDDILYGGTNTSSMSGGAQEDALYGGSGSDTLYGESGDDDLIGGYGADTLHGGEGNDNFVYLDAIDTGDTIEDFVVGEDLIDLSALLGPGYLASAGNTAAVSANSFNWYQDGANTIVTADVTGDSVADFAITLKDVDAHQVQENSFAH